MSLRALSFSLAALLLFGGCSTTYQPRPDARVGVVIRNGGAFYVKDGRLSPVSPFGGDLESVVAPNPEAARFAHRSRNQLLAGVPLYIVGLAAVVVSLAAVPGDARWPLVGAGGVVVGAGLSFMGAGFVNAVDAVNIHNDGADTPPRP